MKKYEILKDQTIEYEGRTLYRIRACANFTCFDKYREREVKVGDLGGYIEKESNLSQNLPIDEEDCVCWVGDDAKVMDNAVVCDSGVVLGNSIAKDNVVVRGCGELHGDCIAYGNAIIEGNLMGRIIIGGNSKIAHGCNFDGDIEFTNDFTISDCHNIFIHSKDNTVIKGSIIIDRSWER